MHVGFLALTSFRYGTGDIMGSQNCVTSTNACGVSGAGGPTAAVSENLFGVTGGAGAGPACGGCWSLTTDSGTNLVVKVNNLCPIQGNELCNMQNLQNVNKEGMSESLSVVTACGIKIEHVC